MARKISVIGAGAVGATLAQRIVESGVADVVLVDILKNVAAGKAFDLLDASPIVGHECTIIGTDDYQAIRGSDIVVITAGLPRKPGMTREDLISKNASIIRDVASKVKAYAPNAILIIVTNPLDTMTYLACTTTGFPRERVFGMAGLLDGARFAYLLANELKVPRSTVETLVLGSHGDTMVPLVSHTRINGKPVTDALSQPQLDAIIKRTRDRGAEIVSLLGSGSAYYSPSAAVFRMIRAVVDGSKELFVASAVLRGEYGLKDVAIGVPCLLGKSGIEKIVEVTMTPPEAAALRQSAQAIKSSIELL